MNAVVGRTRQGKWSRRGAILGASALLTRCHQSNDAHAGLTRGEAGKVVDIRDGDLLILDSGLNVRLAEIEAPREGWRDRPADPFGEKATDSLEFAALGRQAQLYYGGLLRDRYDRALAHVVVVDEAGRQVWLNGYQVRKGLARVRSYADNAARADMLYPLEIEARQAGRGLWGHDAYQILTAEGLQSQQRGLVIVEDRIASVMEISAGESFAEAASDGGLVLALGYLLARADDRISLSPQDRIRFRGGVRREGERRYVSLDHWRQFERV